MRESFVMVTTAHLQAQYLIETLSPPDQARLLAYLSFGFGVSRTSLTSCRRIWVTWRRFYLYRIGCTLISLDHEHLTRLAGIVTVRMPIIALQHA